MIKSKFFRSMLFAVVIFGGIWALLNRDRISNPGDVVQLIQQKVAATVARIRSFSSGSTTDPLNGASEQFVGNVVRVASFRLNTQTTSQPSNESIDLIADLCRQYDAIAFQHLSANDSSWLGRLTERMNEMGAAGTVHHNVASGESKVDYRFITDRVHNPTGDTQSAIVYNRQTLELGQLGPYAIHDPDNILGRKPLVGCFRARGPEPLQSFTFTLVNIEVDSQRSDRELTYLGDLYRAIRDDGRMEDDIIMVGDFNSGDQGLERLRKQAGLTWAISNQPTNIENTRQYDNLVFGESATVEYTGRSGVADFMRQYNLRLEDAKNISGRMPVWAEFSVFEGGVSRDPTQPRQVARGFEPSELR